MTKLSCYTSSPQPRWVVEKHDDYPISINRTDKKRALVFSSTLVRKDPEKILQIGASFIPKTIKSDHNKDKILKLSLR